MQPKLAIGAVNDPLEQEADRVAEQIMRRPDRLPSIAPPAIEAGQERGIATSSTTRHHAVSHRHDVDATLVSADMVTLFRGYAADPARSEAERQIFRDALGAIARGSYERVVTNANIMSGAVPSGVTQTLGNQGIRFRNVLPSMTDLSPWNR